MAARISEIFLNKEFGNLFFFFFYKQSKSKKIWRLGGEGVGKARVRGK